jgi:hypothetical protein
LLREQIMEITKAFKKSALELLDQNLIEASDTLPELLLPLLNKCMEDCLLKMMSQYLGRDAVWEDCKRITVGLFNDLDSPMSIAIDGNHVGILVSEWIENRFVVTFKPSQQ